jgi:excisionase family DNA binding protein
MLTSSGSDMTGYSEFDGGLLTLADASAILRVHRNTLRRWTKEGIVKSYRIGPRGDRRFKLEDIAVLLTEANRNAAPYATTRVAP